MSDEPKNIGPYEVVEQIAEGKMGDVYKATDKEKNRTVAVKVLPVDLAQDEERLERFHREAKAVSMLSHPNIVEIYEEGQDGDLVYFSMEYVPGQSLDKVMKRRRMTLPETFAILKKVALALQEAHEKEIVHRDLNPRNVLASEDLRVIKLTDFGISRSASMTAERGTLTATSMGMGTLHYMAPEQAVDSASVDGRADIYSLGVLFYEMLTGNVPIGKFNLPSRSNSEVPADLDTVVLKCLEADPDDRFQSVGALLRDVEMLEDRLRLGLMSELKGIGQGLKKPTSKIFAAGKIGVALATVVVLALVGGGIWLATQGDSKSETVPELRATDRSQERPPSSIAAVLDEIEPPDTGAEVTVAEGTDANQGDALESNAEEAAGEVIADGEVDTTNTDDGSTAEAQRLFASASAQAERGQIPGALGDIDRLQAQYPSSPLANEALFLRARIEESQESWDAAMTTYTEIGTRSSSTETRAKARYRFGRAALASETQTSQQLALGVFDEVARAYPESEYAAWSLAAKAAIEEAQKLRVESADYDKRVPAAFLTSLELVRRYPGSGAAERSYWLVGEEFEELKLWEQAADAYQQLATRFPTTELDAWWAAGQVLDRRLDRKQQAIEAYRRVPQTSPHYEDAQKRLNRLTK